MATFTDMGLTGFADLPTQGTGSLRIAAREKNRLLLFHLTLDRQTHRIVKVTPVDSYGVGIVVEKGSTLLPWAETCCWLVDDILP